MPNFFLNIYISNYFDLYLIFFYFLIFHKETKHENNF